MWTLKRVWVILFSLECDMDMSGRGRFGWCGLFWWLIGLCWCRQGGII